MKQLKSLVMLLFAALMSFSISACSSDDDEENNGGEISNKGDEIKITKSKIIDNGSVLSWTETYIKDSVEYVTERRFKYSGEKIISYDTTQSFKDEDQAYQAEQKILNNPKMKYLVFSLFCIMNRLVIDYSLKDRSPLYGLTKNNVLYMYEHGTMNLHLLGLLYFGIIFSEQVTLQYIKL